MLQVAETEVRARPVPLARASELDAKYVGSQASEQVANLLPRGQILSVRREFLTGEPRQRDHLPGEYPVEGVGTHMQTVMPRSPFAFLCRSEERV